MNKPLMSKTQNVCLILLAILFLMLGVIMVKQVLDNRKEKETEYEEIAVDSNRVTSAISNWNINYCMGMDSLVNELYKGNFKTSDLAKDYVLFLTLESFNDIPDCTLNEENTKRIEEINEKLKGVLDASLTKEDIESILENGLLNDVYELKLDGDLIEITKKCFQCDKNTEILTSVDKSEINNKYLVVYQKFAYGEEITEDNIMFIDYYKDLDSQKFVERKSVEDRGKLDWSKFDTYKFKFKIDNDNYLLESVEIDD